MNFNSSNQNKGGFNFKNMKSAFTSTLNQATQKSKELANKMKESDLMKKAAESTKKGAENFKKGATSLWNETKAKSTTLTHNLQKNLQKNQAQAQAQADSDVFDTFNDPSVVANQGQVAPQPEPEPEPVAAQPEEDLFDMSAPAVVVEQPAAETEEANELSDVFANQPMTEEANELNDVFANQPMTEEANELGDVFAAQPVSQEANELGDVFASQPAADMNDMFAASQPAADMNDMFAAQPAAEPAADMNDMFAAQPAAEPAADMNDMFAAQPAAEPAAAEEEDVFGNMSQPTIELGGISKFDSAFAGLSEESSNSAPLPSMGMFDMDMTAPVHYEEPKKLSFAELQALNAQPIPKKEETLDDMGFDMGFGDSAASSQPAITSGGDNGLDFMF